MRVTEEEFADLLSPEKRAALKVKKPSKYHNVRTEYAGVKYDSRAEASYAEQLDLLKMASDKKIRPILIERQVRYPISIGEIHICDYVADFRVTYADRVDVIDVKGVRTDVYKIKKKLVEALYKLKIKEITNGENKRM